MLTCSIVCPQTDPVGRALSPDCRGGWGRAVGRHAAVCNHQSLVCDGSSALLEGYNSWVIAFMQRICLSFSRLQVIGESAERGEQKRSLRGTRSKAVFVSIEHTGFGLVGGFKNKPITARQAKTSGLASSWCSAMVERHAITVRSSPPHSASLVALDRR